MQREKLNFFIISEFQFKSFNIPYEILKNLNKVNGQSDKKAKPNDLSPSNGCIQDEEKH